MVNVISDLGKLRIILFWEILKEKNPLLLDADYKPENKYREEEQLFIANTWERLYDDFFTAKNDNKGKSLLKESNDELKLLYKINLLVDIRNHLVKLLESIDVIPMKEYEDLKITAYQIVYKIESKLKLNAFMDIFEGVTLIDKAINSLQNTYTIKNKRNNQEVDKQIDNVYKVVAKVEQILERSIPNINEISVLQWLAYEESAKEKSQSLKELRNGKK